MLITSETSREIKMFRQSLLFRTIQWTSSNYDQNREECGIYLQRPGQGTYNINSRYYRLWLLLQNIIFYKKPVHLKIQQRKVGYEYH